MSWSVETPSTYLNTSFRLLSPARGRGWERGLQAAFEALSPSLSPSGGEEHEEGGGDELEFEMTKKFRGTYTVLITPFTADSRKVDEAALKRLVDFQIAEGIHGLIPLGSTGEFL